jgi:hypothetical protein
MTIIPNKYQLECDEQIRQLTEMYEARIKELESKPIPPINEQKKKCKWCGGTGEEGFREQIGDPLPPCPYCKGETISENEVFQNCVAELLGNGKYGLAEQLQQVYDNLIIELFKHSTPISEGEKLKGLLGFLEMARCPNCDGGGRIGPEGYQCQWCDEKDYFIEQLST